MGDRPHGRLGRRGRKRVLLAVCLYEGNFGDILIHETVEERLKRAGFEVETVEVSEPLAVSSLVLRANASDFLYFVGGGIIERWAPEVIVRFPEVLGELTVPYGVVGLSTGEFDYQRLAPSLRAFADYATFFFTRDRESAETFRLAGASRVPEPGVDVVFSRDPLSADPAGTRALISAGFRNVPYPDVSGELDWASWSRRLKAVGTSVLMEDCSAAQEQLGIPISRVGIVNTINLSRMVIAMRFHVVLMAALLGVPTIPVAYCPKVSRLADQLGLARFCLNIHDHHRLEETAGELERRSAEVSFTLRERVEALRREARGILDATVSAVQAA